MAMPAVLVFNLVLILSGCASANSATDSPVETQAQASEPAVTSTSESQLTARELGFLADPTSVLTGEEVSAAYGVSSLGPAVPVSLKLANVMSPNGSWLLPEGAEQKLGIDQAFKHDSNVSIRFGDYASDGSVSGRNFSPQEIQADLDALFIEGSDPAPGNEAAIRYDIGLGAVGSQGSITVAINARLLVEITIWNTAQQAAHAANRALAKTIITKFRD